MEIKEAINKMNEKMSFKDKYNRGLITEDGFDLSELNEKELDYFRMIYPKYGVLFLTSAPGLAKSAIAKSISKKIQKVEIIKNDKGDVDLDISGKIIAKSLFYIDLRLSMLDETDVGLYPDKVKYDDITVLDHVIPKWAYLANNRPDKKFNSKEKTKDSKSKIKMNDGIIHDNSLPYCGTIIHFEELNRAPLSVRNAALQILLDRCIGYEFEFNNDVFMISTGNLGEEDGTDVEEFDRALNGRLIHIKHDMLLGEWIKYFAQDNVNKTIIDFLTHHPDMYYLKPKDASDQRESAYANPRSWTMLSIFIEKNFGRNSDPNRWLNIVKRLGLGYIGTVANTKFVKYVEDVLKISIKDIIERFSSIQAEGILFSRSKNSELLEDLKKMKLKDLTLKDYQIENIKLFLLSLSKDEVSTYIIHLLDNEYNWKHGEDDDANANLNISVVQFLADERFSDYRKMIFDYVDSDGVSEEDKKEDDGWDF